MLVEVLFYRLARDGFDAADASGDGTLTDDLEHADVARGAGVAAAAEFHGVVLVEDHHTHLVAIFLAKQSRGSHGFGFVNRDLSVGHIRDVFTDFLVDDFLYLMDLHRGHLGEVAEVEAQALVIDQGTFLFHMAPQDLSQSSVHQVGSAVVVSDALATFHVDGGYEHRFRVLWQLFGDVDDEIVFFDRVHDLEGLVLGSQGAGVAYLTAHLSIERGLVEDDFKMFLFFGHHLAETQDVALAAHFSVADKLSGLFTLLDNDPVAIGFFGGLTRAVFLFFKVGFETFHVNTNAFFSRHQLGKVDGETVGVEQLKGEVAVNILAGMLLHIAFKAFDALGQCAQEGGFLFADDFADQLLLRLDLRVVVFHLLY